MSDKSQGSPAATDGAAVTSPDSGSEKAGAAAERTPRESALLMTAAKGGVVSFGGAVVGKLLMLTLQILVSRLYGPSYYGLFVTGMIVCQIVQILAALGLQKGAMRFMAIAHDRRHYAPMPGILRTATVTPLIAGVVLGALLYGLAPTLAVGAFKDPDLTAVLRLFAYAVPFFALLRIVSDLSRAFKTTRYAVLVEDLLFSALQIVLFVVFHLFGCGFASVAYAFIVASLIGALAMWTCVRRQIRTEPRRAPPPPGDLEPGAAEFYQWRSVLAYSIPLVPIGLMLIADFFMDIIMLNALSDATNVGQYAAAARWGMLITLVIHPANMIFVPLMAGQCGLNRLDQVKVLYRAATRWVYFAMLPIALFMVLAREPMMLLFGKEFTHTGPTILAILMLGSLFAALTGSAGLLLTVSGKQYGEMACVAGGLVVNVLLNLQWIPRYGAVGAALATVVSNLLTDVGRVLVVQSVLRMHPFTRRMLAPTAMTLGLVGGGWVVQTHWAMGFVCLLGVAGTAAVAVLLVILFFGLEPHDQVLWAATRARFGRKGAAPPPPSPDPGVRGGEEPVPPATGPEPISAARVPAPASGARHRVLVIGVDGASINLIRAWAQEGRLPNFQRLMARGASGWLKTVPNMNSGPAWTSIYTGCNPGTHGIYYFYEKTPRSYAIRYLNGGDCDAEPLWSLLSRQGRSVGVLNVPMTYPARPVNGVLVSGFDAPSMTTEAVYPPSLLAEIKRELPGYVIELGLTNYIRQGRFDALVEKAMQSVDMRTRAALHFMRTRSWDFFMVVYRVIDITQHAYWKFDEPWYRALRPEMAARFGGTIRRFYEKIDREIGTLLASVDDDTTVVIVSDHGGGPLQTGVELLNDFLMAEGYLKRLGPAHISGGGGLVRRALRQCADWVDTYTPRHVKGALLRLLPGLHNRTAQMQIFPAVDWRQTRVFGTLRPELWINVKEREPLGIVEPGAEYEALVAELKDKLLRWVDPVTGRPVIADVKRREETYHGRHLDKAPDLAVYFNPDIIAGGIAFKRPDGSLHVVKTAPREAHVDDFLSGGHADNGTVILYGPRVKPGCAIEGASLIDIAPTVLHAMRLSSAGMDGRALVEAFEPMADAVAPPPPSAAPPPGAPAPAPAGSQDYSEQESAQVARKLKNLGYM